MDIIHEKIRPGGGIELPRKIMDDLHLKVGETITMKIENRKIVLEPEPKRKLSGIIKLEDPDLDRFIDSEEWWY